ncbi:hypothetical protein QFZ37_002296 [Chryseobacterium ginsenosidimutans]|uniref:hypothetical protein n=1 Tax=Chryseobacterium ginsenosidimutans TaxID=687846 RepID=UPI00278B94F2|nr:hypothetical protein [Chryseobacterium ginsenosidimutans]MDQ0593927.1 hypothetical protein [Chryseobacterium ginsenosidimutans]
MKVSILESKFRRSKLELKYTELWNTLDISKKNMILDNINLSINEIPIITLFINNFEWWLITDQVIYNYNNILDIINLSDIFKIEISKDIKILDKNYLNIYYKSKISSLELEKKSWIIIIEILRHLTHINISIDKNFDQY